MSIQDSPEVDHKHDLLITYKWYIDFFNEKKSSDGKINPTHMEKFVKECDYKNANIPVIISKMKFKLYDILKLKEWQKNCLCSITCKAIKMSMVMTSGGSQAYVETDTSIAFSSTFVPIFDSKVFKSKYNKEDIEKRSGNFNAIDLNSDEVGVNMVLLNVTSQNALKTMFCQVIEPGCDVGTVIQWMLSEMPIEKALVDLPDNGGEQGSIIIPPMSFLQAMNHLQSVYGIYENGLQIFYDTDGMLYILNKWETEHEREDKSSSVTHLFIKQAEEGAVGKIARIEDTSGEAKYIGVIPVEYISNEELEGESQGNTLIFSSFQQGMDAVAYKDQKVDSSTGKNVSLAITRNKKTNNMTGIKALADYDELNNIFNMSSYFNEIEARAKVYKVTISNASIGDFKPNMFIDMKFEDIDKNNEQGGIYHINRVSYVFNRTKEADIMSTSTSDESDKYAVTKTSCTCTLEISRKNDESDE